ncbi:hypothetical protein DKX38_006504 [Salix brachista]|uniref:Protein BUD31 homolog n=1 Tax=Salix brachista TaxID=2182728 RepID=A0A5N5N2F7_9ROSI|nr:hypothetical protein DKX38_006504 [Salix brachista]
MPKVRRSRIKYPEGWELIEPTLRELDGKMREAELDPHDGKRKCEALWPIFKITHQKSRYIYDLYYRRNEISKELYEFCLDQGYGDRNLIAKWKKVFFSFLSQDMNDCAASAASNPGTTTLARLVFAGFQNISGKRRLLSVCIVVVEAVQVVIDCYFVSFLCDSLPASLKPRVRFGCVIEAKAGVTPMELSTGVPRTDMGWLELANEPTKTQKLQLYFLAKTPEFGKQKLTATLSFRNFGTLQSSEPFEFLKIQDNVGSWLFDLDFFYVLKSQANVRIPQGVLIKICSKTGIDVLIHSYAKQHKDIENQKD